MNYSTALNATNGTPVPVCQHALLSACNGGHEIRFGAFSASTHVVADVVGYFVSNVFATVEGDDDPPTVLRGNGLSLISGVVREGTHYRVATTRDLRGCAIVATGGNSNGETSHMASNVTTDDVTTTGFDLTISDDLGTPVFDDFSFSVTC